jgi:uncharacterized protein YqeY
MSPSILQKLKGDQVEAMKAREKDRLTLIRMLIADIRNEEIKLGKQELEESEILTVLRRGAKMRADAIADAKKVGRDETAAKEAQELHWIEAYLPQQLSEDAVREKAQALIAELGIESKKDMGKFMKAWMSQYRDVSDGKTVQKVLADLLS